MCLSISGWNAMWQYLFVVDCTCSVGANVGVRTLLANFWPITAFLPWWFRKSILPVNHRCMKYNICQWWRNAWRDGAERFNGCLLPKSSFCSLSLYKSQMLSTFNTFNFTNNIKTCYVISYISWAYDVHWTTVHFILSYRLLLYIASSETSHDPQSPPWTLSLSR